MRCLLLLIVLSLLIPGCRAAPPAAVDPHRLKISVNADGLHRLSLAEMQAAGLDINALERKRLALSHAGTPIPYLLHDGALLFYGQAPKSRYTKYRVYTLTAGKPGQAIPTVSAAPSGHDTAPTAVRHTTRLEENRHYESRAAGSPDRWFWQQIGHGQRVTVPLSLPVVGDGSATMQLGLWGASHHAKIANDHDLTVRVNGRFTTTIYGDGRSYFTATLSLPPGTLHTGANELILDNSAPDAAPLDVMHLDAITITTHAPATMRSGQVTFVGMTGNIAVHNAAADTLIFDVQTPTAPRLLVDWIPQGDQITLSAADAMQILAITPAAAHTPAQLSLMRQWQPPPAGADLVIITTDDLRSALSPLVAAREAQGLRVAIVTVAEIYDVFAHGTATPDAIRQFLRQATRQWPTPPRYVLLVGDATWDHRGYANPLPAQHVPAPMVPVAYGGETSSDARLADVDGDLVPDVAIGRWPVDHANQVRSLVARTLAYENAQRRFPSRILVDGSEPTFAALAQRVWDNGRFPAHITTTPAATFADDEPAWLAAYIGHGSLNRWGRDGLLHSDTVDTLPLPPLLLQFTCLTGLFAHPAQLSLTEQMLHAGDGPVAVVAATSLTLSAQQEPFARRLVAALHDTAVPRIGDAFQQAKHSLNVTDPAQREIGDTFTLFADPSLPLQRPGRLTIGD